MRSQQPVFYPSSRALVAIGTVEGVGWMGHNEAAVCYTEASWGLNRQTATHTLLPAPDALWVPGGQFTSNASVWARHQHTLNVHALIYTRAHLTWFTMLSYNPICRERVSLMTWQPDSFFIYYLATKTSHLLSADHNYVFISKHLSFWGILLVSTNTWVVSTATRS